MTAIHSYLIYDRGDPTGQWGKAITFLLFSITAAKSLQSCPTLCNPIDSSPPGSPVPGILQARTLEWVAISFSNAWKWKGKVKSLSRVRLLETPWTAAHQAPPSMGFSRQEYWSGVLLPSPLHSLGQQIWKTQQWPQDWKTSVFIPIPKRQCQRMFKLPHSFTHFTC